MSVEPSLYFVPRKDGRVTRATFAVAGLRYGAASRTVGSFASAGIVGTYFHTTVLYFSAGLLASVFFSAEVAGGVGSGAKGSAAAGAGGAAGFSSSTFLALLGAAGVSAKGSSAGLAAGVTYDYRLSASNGVGSSAFSTAATARALTAYDQWKLDEGFSLTEPPTADSDGDGILTRREVQAFASQQVASGAAPSPVQPAHGGTPTAPGTAHASRSASDAQRAPREAQPRTKADELFAHYSAVAAGVAPPMSQGIVLAPATSKPAPIHMRHAARAGAATATGTAAQYLVRRPF